MSIDFDALIRFLQALVSTKALSGEEKPVIDLVAAEMRRLNYDTITVDAFGNLIGIINGAKPGKTLWFDAHADTVGVSPGAPWQYPPFEGTIVGERMYGRGTTDMKGTIAAVVYAAAAADRTRLAGRILVSVSVMEEVIEGYPLQPIVDEYHPDFVVIGEPTDLNLVHGGRGRAELTIETFGVPAHSSSPHLAVNAIHLMLDAIRAIEELTMPTDPLMGQAVLGLTDIISKPYPGNSMIPDYCRATYDRRLVRGENEADILAEIAQLPALEKGRVSIEMANYTTYTGANISEPKFFPAWEIAPSHPFVQQALAGLRVAGLDPSLRVFQFNTNATYTAGKRNIPTIGFGPSPEGRAHIVDEFIELTDLRAIARGYLGIINAVLD